MTCLIVVFAAVVVQQAGSQYVPTKLSINGVPNTPWPKGLHHWLTHYSESIPVSVVLPPTQAPERMSTAAELGRKSKKESDRESKERLKQKRKAAREKSNKNLLDVITLLEDMTSQLEVDAKVDEKAHCKMTDWCEIEQKKTHASIVETKEKAAVLKTVFDAETAKSKAIKEEIKALMADIETKKVSLAPATALRKKQNTAFEASKNLVKSALSELHKSLGSDPKTGRLRKRSSGVDFTKVLDNKQIEDQAVETADAASFVVLKEANAREIEDAKFNLARKKQDRATINGKIAQAASEKEDLDEALPPYRKLSKQLTAKCTAFDKQATRRKVARATELTALSKCVTLLRSKARRDSAVDKVSALGFLQISLDNKSKRKAASDILSKIPKLSLLAASVESNPFVQVNAAIDTMLGDLKSKMKGHSVYCVEEQTSNTATFKVEGYNKFKWDSKNDVIEATITEKDAAIKELNIEIGKIMTERVEAVAERSAEHRAFVLTAHRKHVSQLLLERALGVIKEALGVTLIQVQQGTSDEQPSEMKDYQKSKDSTAIVSLLSTLVAEAKEMERQEALDERASLLLHQGFMSSMKETKDAKDAQMVGLIAERAAARQVYGKVKEEIVEEKQELGTLNRIATAMKKSCIPAGEGLEQVDALTRAKEVLSTLVGSAPGPAPAPATALLADDDEAELLAMADNEA